MEISLNSLRAVVTDTPLTTSPRLALDIPQLLLGEFTDRARFEQLLPRTFGSQEWLGSENDDVLFDNSSRELVSMGLHLPAVSAPPQVGVRLLAETRAVRGSLRAQEVRDFSLAQTTVLYCGPEATELTCLRNLAVLDDPLDARLVIAPGLALMVQASAVVGWSLNDPVQYLTTGYAVADPAPPAPSTRLRLAECLALITRPLVDDVMDKEPDAWHRIRTTEQALREQREDLNRAATLHRLVARLIEDYENW
ncbi:hypothetical protein GTX14_28160 [Streptomyces sp. SID4944]|nr:hypothetical protein [Streptomyces sp. SID4944]